MARRHLRTTLGALVAGCALLAVTGCTGGSAAPALGSAASTDAASPSASMGATGHVAFSLTSGGAARTYRLYAPAVTADTGPVRIDPRRIYVTGFSNGGMLAYRIACELGGSVAAIGVQSATLEYSPCQPAAPVSVLHIHGDADANVPLGGGRGSGESNADFVPPPQAAATLATADGCDPTAVGGPDPTPANVQLSSWQHCPAGVDVQFATVHGLAHTWMTASAARIWAFLAAHPLP